jgi:MFS family permease
LRTVLRRRVVLAVLAAGTIAAAGRGLGVLSAYVPAFLHDGRHLSSITTGALFTVVLVGSVVGPAVAGWLADRVGRRTVLIVVYPAAAVCLAAYVFVGSSVWALAGVGLLVGAFAYAESPLLQSLYADATHGADSRAVFGVYFAVAYGVGALWQVAVGWLVTDYGFRTAFCVMAASFVVAGLLVLAVRGTTRSPTSSGA